MKVFVNTAFAPKYEKEWYQSDKRKKGRKRGMKMKNKCRVVSSGIEGHLVDYTLLYPRR
jgi:hypothetical protein